MTLPQIRDIARAPENSQARGFFLVADLDLRKTRQGQDYAWMVFKDSTGSLAAKVWKEKLPLLHKGGIGRGSKVMAELKVRRFRGKADAEVIFIRPAEDAARKDGYDEALLQPRSHRNADEMFAELLALADRIEKDGLRSLARNLLHRYRESFKTHPAARRIHHAYRGGLLEHTLNVARAAASLGTLYNAAFPLGINRDVLLAAAILHDIGKIEEIDPNDPDGHTAAGNLVGHIVLGHGMVKEAAREVPGIEPEDFLHLEHLLLSHHGRREWGAAEEPKTAEAIILHYADDCDAKLGIFFSVLERSEPGSDFTPPDNVLGRPLYRKGVPEPPEPPEPPPSGEQSELGL